MEFLLFILSSFAFDLYPGEVFFILLTIAITQGKKAGIYGAAGVALCDFVACVSGVFGLTILFKIFPFLFILMKTIGGFYLTYIALLGIKSYLKENKDFLINEIKKSSSDKQKNYISFTKEMFLIGILNPIVYFGDSAMIMKFAGEYNASVKFFYILVFSLISFISFTSLSILFNVEFIKQRLKTFHKKIKITSSLIILLFAISIFYEVTFEIIEKYLK